MAERNVRLRVGGFVVVAAVALTGLVVLFGGAPTLFNARTKYTIDFPEAPNIAAGTPVRKSGVRIGQVTGLDIDEGEGKVRLRVEVDPKYLPRRSEEAVISRGLLNGDTNIDFVPRAEKDGTPVPRGEAYPPDSEIVGVPPFNPQRLITSVSGTVPDAKDAFVAFTETVRKFEKVGPKAEAAMDEIAGFAKSARELLPELRETNKRVQEFIGPGDSRPTPEKERNAGPEFVRNGAVPPVDIDPTAPPTLRTLTREVQEFVSILRPLAEDFRKLMKDNQGDLTRALKGLRELVDKGNDLLSDENRKALASTLKLLDAASRDLLTEENRKAVTSILASLKDASADLPKAVRMLSLAADRADGTLKDISDAAKELTARLTQAKGAIDNIDKATKPIAENAEPVLKNVARAADELAKTVADARGLIAGFNKGEGTLGKVVNDPQLYNQLVDAAVNLTRTLARAEKVAKDLEVFADKIARNPERFGIGGALKGSTPLKEAPTAPLPYNTPYPKATPTPASRDGVPPIAPVPGGAEVLPPPTSSFKLDVTPTEAPVVTPQPVTNVQYGPRSPVPPLRPALGEPVR